ncbi:CsgE family curli-type amyloid fiber assembly protein [Noviherbaspirillum saxi]|nr:CsgE family curli-type amyloid fiber assembly protein [Noviherbaspirillum saxi]
MKAGALMVWVFATAALAAYGVPVIAAAATNVSIAAKADSHDSFGGVVVNQAVTVAGQEFFQYFVANWRDRDLSERYAISITERPSARWGSQVWIEFRQRRIFQAPLPTARAGIKALSEQATEAVYQMVADTEVERLLFREPDLGPDEL